MTVKTDLLLAALQPRAEQLTFHGVEVVVRELATAADTEAFRDGADAQFKFLTRCVFDADGQPLFTDEQIPALKSASRAKLLPLLEAVMRVNGLLAEDTEKNSAASPAAS